MEKVEYILFSEKKQCWELEKDDIQYFLLTLSTNIELICNMIHVTYYVCHSGLKIWKKKCNK